MMNLGDYVAGATVEFKWNSFSGLGGSITRATNGSIRIYKNHSDTQRSSANGITDTEDFDSLPGLHHVQIDLSDNTDAGFYAEGNEYQVVLQGAVIDGQTVNAVLAHFSIGRNLSLAHQNQIAAAVGAPSANELRIAIWDSAPADWELSPGTAGYVMRSLELSVGNLDAPISVIDTVVDAIAAAVADVPTNAELATALAGADDAVLAALSAHDAKFTFSVSGKVDANITHVNEIEVTGDGEPGTEWNPA